MFEWDEKKNVELSEKRKITFEEAEKIGGTEYVKRNTWLRDNGFIK